jgi:hypothetical protein
MSNTGSMLNIGCRCKQFMKSRATFQQFAGEIFEIDQPLRSDPRLGSISRWDAATSRRNIKAPKIKP